MKNTATVVKNAGSHFLLSPLPRWEPFPAVLRGKTRMDAGTSTNPVAVGDVVEYLTDGPVADMEHPAVICSILPRRNHLMRRSTNLSRQSHVIAANLDRVFLVCTLYFPAIKLPFLDRQLVACGMYGIPVTVVLNKVDLYAGEAAGELEAFRHTYCNLAGYDVLEVSARTGEGLESLRSRCTGLCLFTGESGVGKSSLIKALDPSLDPKIGRISDAHLQGKHTTSLYEMYPLSGGKFGGDAFVIDTPGLRGFGLVELEKEQIHTYFPEMLRVADDCRFVPCTHTHEPGCAVKQALEDGLIAPERYNSYLGMLEEDEKFR